MSRPAFDLTALSWCLGEIRESLARAESELEKQLQSMDGDTARVGAARSWLHQAHGALQVVDLEGVAAVTQEAETLLDRCDRGELPFNGEFVRVLGRAFAAIVDYLEGVVAGSRDSAVALFPHYRDLLALRAAERIEPADLYSVDLTVRPPKAATTDPLDTEGVARVRAAFEKGLLGFLRNADDAAALGEMHAAIERLHRAHQGSSQRTFWWLAAAFFDALRAKAMPVDLYAKRLVARINLQIRRTLQQGTPIAERMLRDILFLLARAGSGSPAADEAKRLYALDGTVPEGFETPRYGIVDPRTLRIAREATVATKAAWEKAVRGGSQDLPGFAAAAQQLDATVGRLPWPGLQRLSNTLTGLRRALSDAGSGLAELLSLEVATALLFVEHALERGAGGASQYDRRAVEMAERIERSIERQELDPTPMPEWLTALSRAAQERMTTAAFVVELQTNLKGCEKSLDAFFRDPTQRGELPALAPLLRQVGGALRLLGHAEAAAGADGVSEQIAAFAALGEDDAPPTAADCERVAESLGALGFFVESLQRDEAQGRAFEFRRGDDAFVARLGEPSSVRDVVVPQEADAALGVAPFDVSEPFGVIDPDSAAPTIVPPTRPAVVDPTAGASLEHLLSERRARLRMQFDAWRTRAGDAAARAAVRDTVVAIRDEAMLLDDGELRGWAGEALGRLDDGRDAADEALLAAIDRIAAGVAEAPVAAVELPAEDAVDDELLGIFLDEADEVLAAIEESRTLSAGAPSDGALLTTMRRGFHTLKGSSRMVGLGAFGEAAWAMEQVLNGWVADERPGTPALYALVADTHGEMTQWVRRLRDDASSAIDPSVVLARALALRDGVPVEAATVGAAVAEPHVEPRTEAQVESHVESHLESHVESHVEPRPEDSVPSFDLATLEAAALDEPTIELTDVQDIADPLAFETVATSVSDPAIDLSSIDLDFDAVDPADAQHAIDTTDTTDTIDADAGALDALVGAAALPPESGEALIPLTDEPLDDDIPADEESIRIGERTLSAPLYRIFLDEADQILATLDAALDGWRADAARPVDEPTLRAVHTLGGSTRIVRLTAIHEAADALERFMLGRSLSDGPLRTSDIDDVAFVIERFRASLHRFAAGDEPGDDPAMIERAETLADRWALPSGLGESASAAAPVDDARETIAMPEVAATPEAHIATASPALVPVALVTPAAPAVPAETLEGLAAVVDEIDAELAPVFIEEADELLPRVGDALRTWQQRPDDASSPESLMRLLHTVKGSARMAGAMRLGQLVHDMETRIESASALPRVPAALIDDLVARHDQVLALYEAVRDPGSASAQAAARAVVDALSGCRAARADASAAPADTPAQLTGAEAPGADRTAAAGTGAGAPAQQLIRVRADLLDRLVNEAGEVSIARARLDNELGGIRLSLGELTENVNRLRSQLREIELAADSQIQARTAKSRELDAEFDPLEFDRYTRFQELTRMLAESVNDVATVQQNALRNLDEANRDLQRQSQVTRDLQQDLMRIRMVQFGSIADRLYRVVRQAAKELDKRVHLDLKGTNSELDRGVLERMAGPIEHLLRNAVAHGIEPRVDRIAAGKSETGEITLEVRQEGNEVILAFADDGRGLDYGRIRTRAIERGLLPADAHPGERELADLIFMPGFSTATEVTAIAGRGVGMDVVRAEVAAMGGRIDLESVPGRGTRFTVHLPVSLAVAQVVLLTVGGHRIAVASALIEQVLQMKPEAIASAYAQHAVDWHGQPVPLYFLGSLLELSGGAPLAQRYSPVVIVRSGSTRIALHVDHVSPSQEVVVKHVGPQLARLTGMAGATVLGNGDIVLILNPVQIAATGRGAQAGEGDTASFAPTRIEIAPTVMVVDDSVTVRKVTQRLLTREGYQVMLAKDGIDALRQLQDAVPDVMLLDIEMPRMDGFDLTKNLRGDERLKHLPIVMITSRTADKHRNHALSLGVDVFLGKPFDEAELLGHVREMAARRQPVI